MSFSIIVAIAENRAIGKNNDLLWYISNDLKRFKQLTTGHSIIMGRNTFFSLPKGPLPNRRNIIISDKIEDYELEKKYEDKDCKVVDSIEKAIEICNPTEENFIIGGGSIYKQFLPHADNLYLTLVHEKVLDADVFFPEYSSKDWKEVEREDFLNEEPAYSYLKLKRE
jgi:dihydrofolate reductase